MTTNRLAKSETERGVRSPTDPQECCDWANSRLHQKAVEANLHWVVTGNADKPIALQRFM